MSGGSETPGPSQVQHSMELNVSFILQKPTVSRDRVMVHKAIEILCLEAVVCRFRLGWEYVVAGDVVIHSHG